MNKKIIFLDIDGTLADRDRVPLSARRACRKARKNGHLLYICSGRSLAQIRRGILKIGFDGVISSSGAHIETIGEGGCRDVLFHASFDGTNLRRITDYFDQHKVCYMLELPDKGIAGPGVRAYFKNLFAGKKRTPGLLLEKFFTSILFRRLVFDESDYSKEDVCKVVFFESGGIVFEDVQRKFGEEYELFRCSIPISGMTGGEISPRGVHKGAALEKVMLRHGVPREDSIAIGDSDNDRTLLECAGVGIAMGNAGEDLKRAADDITDSIGNSGLAKAFKKYGLVS
jgi:Cof subfamily protein (haloacid dehalogenase superfamily)